MDVKNQIKLALYRRVDLCNLTLPSMAMLSYINKPIIVRCCDALHYRSAHPMWLVTEELYIARSLSFNVRHDLF